jgi:putative flippase GtrA
MIQKIWLNEKFRYLIIGAYNTFVGYGIFVVLWILWGQLLHYIAVLCISHAISVINAFISYRTFVFRKRGAAWGDFFRFNLVYLGAFTFNVLALPFLIEVLKLYPLVAQALVVVVTIVASYISHKKFSFRAG